jgi:hypothetical protein
MASVTDKLRKGAPAFSTTLAADKGAGASTATLSSAATIPTTTAVDFTVGRIDSNGSKTPSLKAVYTATLSGSTISNLVLREGTDQLHKAGTPVEITLTAASWNDLVDWGLTEHNQNGTHAAITPTSVTTSGAVLTTPKIITSLNDSNGNELFKVAATGSAVNELTVTNAITGNGPTLSATGDDTNVDLNFSTKGTGKIKGLVNNLYNPYKFAVYRNASFTFSSADAKVQFETEEFDTSNNYDNATNYRFTAPIAGFYNLQAEVSCTAVSGGQYVVSLYKNGSSFRFFNIGLAGASSSTGFGGSTLIQAAANDFFEVYFRGSSGSTGGPGQAQTYFSGFLVSAA